MKFGEKLKILRILNGLTQSQIAEEAGLQQSSIARYEKSDAVPYSGPLAAIVGALGEQNNVAWLHGRGTYQLPQIAIYKPMSVYQEYTSLMIRGIDQALVGLLPVLVDDIGLIPRRILRSDCGAVFYATDEANLHGVAVVARSEIVEALYAGFPALPKDDTISVEEELNRLCFADQLPFAELMEMNPTVIQSLKECQPPVEPLVFKKLIITLQSHNFPDGAKAELQEIIKTWMEKYGINDCNMSDPELFESSDALLDPKVAKLIISAGLKLTTKGVV